MFKLMSLTAAALFIEEALVMFYPRNDLHVYTHKMVYLT